MNRHKLVHNNSQRHSTHPVCEVQTEFNKESGASDCRENAATTPQYHSYLTSLEVDNGLKASTDSQFFAHHSEVANQVLSLDSYLLLILKIPLSQNLVLSILHQLCCHQPWPQFLLHLGVAAFEDPSKAAMKYSMNPKIVDRMWTHLPYFTRIGSNDRFFLPRGDHLNSCWPMTTTCSWLQEPAITLLTGKKENSSPNITTTIQPKRPITKSSSVGLMYNNTDLHPFPTPLDTRQVPNLAHSGYRISNTGDEHESFKSLSSKPTTSSLLLSLRRSNLRNSSAEPTQSETRMTRSDRSRTLPSRVVLKTPSFAHPVSDDAQIPEYPDTPARTEEIPVSQFPSHLELGVECH